MRYIGVWGIDGGDDDEIIIIMRVASWGLGVGFPPSFFHLWVVGTVQGTSTGTTVSQTVQQYILLLYFVRTTK